MSFMQRAAHIPKRYVILCSVILVGVAGIMIFLWISSDHRLIKHEEKLLQLPKPQNRLLENFGCEPWDRPLIGGSEFMDGCYINLRLEYDNTVSEKVVREHLKASGWKEQGRNIAGFFLGPRGIHSVDIPFTKEISFGRTVCAGIEESGSPDYIAALYLFSDSDDNCKKMTKQL